MKGSDPHYEKCLAQRACVRLVPLGTSARRSGVRWPHETGQQGRAHHGRRAGDRRRDRAAARGATGRGSRSSGLEPERLRALAAELGPGHAWFEADVTDQAARRGRGGGHGRAAGRHRRRGRQRRHRQQRHRLHQPARRARPHDRREPVRRRAHGRHRAPVHHRAQGLRADHLLGRRVHDAARHGGLHGLEGRRGAVRQRAAAGGRPQGREGRLGAPVVDRHRPRARPAQRAEDVRGRAREAPVADERDDVGGGLRGRDRPRASSGASGASTSRARSRSCPHCAR